MKAGISFESKCVVRLEARTASEDQLTSAPATGFFWRHEEEIWLVTNRHVVTGRNENNRPLDHGFDPFYLDARFYEKTGPSDDGYTPTGSKSIRVSLWKDGMPDWSEHQDCRNFDVVVMNLGGELDVWAINDKHQDDRVWLEAGADCFVVGYPEKLLGPALTPVWKRASIATEPELEFDELPIFLCDTASRPGMSGSPVFLRAIGNFGREGAPLAEGVFFGFWTKFIGIYAGRCGVDDDGFQLGRIWQGTVLKEIFDAPKAPCSPFDCSKN